ncbi:MAG: DNA primase [Flavobacteriales bacterium]|nr:MAG: DNA primase [Flavobacteriales bacterium]
MISKATIDKVYETARLEEVIGDFVQLKKSGSNFKGLSPFSDERTPSFMVSPVKQIWKDFSSGKGGNVVAFLMEHEHFTYPEAIKYLAKKYNIEIEETERSDEQKLEADERESMYLVSEYAQKYFSEMLWGTTLGKAIGLSYFKERGFTDEIIKKFGLGYCLDQWDGFTKAALDKGYQLDFLEKTGLTIVKEDTAQPGNKRMFDRFKGRVMFPIHSMSGRILGFGGRILANDKKAAKYQNSPESDIYHKSKVLYGIYFAKQAIAKEDNCYLVEGYTDVIQLHQRGILNVVASSGTALSPEQIRLINRLTKNITVLFDGDAAGLRASLRGIDLILEQGMNVKVCTFPEGEDPDSFAKNNELEEIIIYLEQNAKDFIQFKASLLMSEAANDPIKRADTVRDIVNSISKIPDHIQKEIYIQECAQIMNISEAVLFSTLAQIGKKEQVEATKKAQQDQKAFEVVRNDNLAEKVDIQQVHEREILKILLQYGMKTDNFLEFYYETNDQGELEMVKNEVCRKVAEKIYLELQEDEIEFADPKFRQAYNILIESLINNENIDFSSWIGNLPKEISETVIDLDMNENKYELDDWERRNIFVKSKESEVVLRVSQTITSIRLKLINDLIGGIADTLQKDDGVGPSQEQWDDLKNYNELKKNLAERNGLVIKHFG